MTWLKEIGEPAVSTGIEVPVSEGDMLTSILSKVISPIPLGGQVDPKIGGHKLLRENQWQEFKICSLINKSKSFRN